MTIIVLKIWQNSAKLLLRKSECRNSSVDSSAPSYLLPRVRVPSLLFLFFSIYIVYLSFELECEKNENKQKRGLDVPFKKTLAKLLLVSLFCQSNDKFN